MQTPQETPANGIAPKAVQNECFDNTNQGVANQRYNGNLQEPKVELLDEE